jgi:hypothetical protein
MYASAVNQVNREGNHNKHTHTVYCRKYRMYIKNARGEGGGEEG